MAGLKAFISAALRKRLVLALTVGGVIFSSVYAFAATLSVGTDSLGAGNSVVASCAGTTTLKAQYTTLYDSTFAGFRVSTVRLASFSDAGATTPTAFPSDCIGKSVTVNLAQQTTNTSLGQVTVSPLALAQPGDQFVDIQIPASGTSSPAGTGSFPVHADAVGNVSVVITG